MLASINPLGERARHNSYRTTVTAYVAGSALGGAAFGASLGLAGTWFAAGALPLVVLAVLAAGGLVLDARVLGARVPGPRRQVDERWLGRYRGWVYGIGFGAQLGVGFATIVVASVAWVAFACALFSGGAAAGALVGVVFGTARAIPVFAVARVADAAELRAIVRRLDRVRPHVARVTATVQAFVVASFAVASFGAITSGRGW